MAVGLRTRGRPLDTDDLRALEHQLGRGLPQEYSEFLLAQNGGIPELNIFHVPETKNASGVNEFLSAEGIVAEIETYGARLSSDLVPIALAEGGNLVCLDTSDGSAVFWDHEMEDSDPIFYLASGFREFVGALEPFDPKSVELKPGQVQSVWVNPDLFK